MLEHDARVHGLEGREHVEAGEVLCACAIRSAEELEQVFAIVSGNDLVKTLVRRVGLQGGERVRELGDEIFCVVARLGGFCSLLDLFRRFAQPGFAACALSGDGRRELECRCLERVHLEAHVGGIFALLFISAFSPLLLPQQIAIFILGLILGALVPFMLLQSAIRRRKAAIRRQLPEFLDFLCVSVQAGLSFDGAVTKIVNRMKGPLMDEFRRMLRDMGLGMDRQRTLNQLAKRCDVEEIYLFTASVIQAEHLGTSMSRTLKMQADNMRDRHRQTVRALALKAPVKIIFPMILFIFPSIFVMVIFPAALTLLKSLNR